MPSIPVAPEVPGAESPAGAGPVIGGYTFKRPTRRDVSVETVGQTVTLAGGEERAYRAGRRRVVSLEWAKMTESEVSALEIALTPPFVPYADDVDAEEYVVGTQEALSVAAIPGTFPVRFTAGVSLRERGVR